MQNSKRMEFTGERYLPSVGGEIKYEHLHRYFLCKNFVKGKSVLDIASGEGYGSDLIAEFAESVVGVDISPESIEYARSYYRSRENVNFLVGSCDSIPVADKSVDVVVSFETIEHHDKHEEMMLEIKRTLKPDGTLIISSPNRLTYSDETGYSNPYHVKELYYDQLVDLLDRHFSCVKIYGQRIAAASFVFPLDKPLGLVTRSYTDDHDKVDQHTSSLEAPIYYVAICSDNEINVNLEIDSIYIDPNDDLLKSLHKSYQSQLQQTQSQLQQTQSQLQQTRTESERSQSRLQQTQSQLQQIQSQLQQTRTESERSQSRLQQTQSQLQQIQSQLQQTQTESEQTRSQLQQTQDTIEAMEISKFWRLRKVWFKIKNIIRPQKSNIQ